MSNKFPVDTEILDGADLPSFHGRTLSISLTVEDLEKSLVWYQSVVGFAVEQKHERDGRLVAVSVRAGDVRILLGQNDGAKGWDRQSFKGFSFQITTDDDIDALATRIREAGGVLEMEPTDTPWGARVFRLQDPDGFLFTISSERLTRSE